MTKKENGFMAKSSVAKSLAFKFSEQFLVKGLGLLIGIILARLLSPTEFGQIAIIMVFINLSHSFVQSGLGTALVQNKTADKRDYSTVFYISLAVAALLVGVLWFAAPAIGTFYENDALVLPLRVYAFSLFFFAFNTVQVAKLSREMQFGKQFVCNLSACVLSGVIGCVLAYLGFGIWSLIAYYFSSAVITSVAMLFVVRWWPSLTFSLERAKELFSYGWKMMVSAFLCSLYADIRTLIIGKRFSEEDLGYYNRGQQFSDVIFASLDSAVQSVMFPVLSRSQEDREKMKRILRRTVSYSALLSLPILFGMAMVADPFVRVVLTEKWLPSVPFLQIICLGYLARPLSSACLVAIKSTGKSGTYMILEIVRRLAMLLVLLVSVFAFGTLTAIAWGFLVSTWLDTLIVSVPTKRIVGYSLWEQWCDISRILLCTLLMGVCIYPISLLPIPPIVILLAQIALGAAVYVGAGFLLRIPAMRELLSMAKRILHRGKKTEASAEAPDGDGAETSDTSSEA